MTSCLLVGHNAYYTIDMHAGDKPLWTPFDGGALILGSPESDGCQERVNLDGYVDLPRSTILVLVKTGREAFFTQFRQIIIPVHPASDLHVPGRRVVRGTCCRDYDNFPIMSIEELWELKNGSGIIVDFADGFIRKYTAKDGTLVVETIRTDLEANDVSHRTMRGEARWQLFREKLAASAPEPKKDAELPPEPSTIAAVASVLQAPIPEGRKKVRKAAKPAAARRRTVGRDLSDLAAAIGQGAGT